MATAGAFIYNLITDLVGGVEVTSGGSRLILAVWAMGRGYGGTLVARP